MGRARASGTELRQFHARVRRLRRSVSRRSARLSPRWIPQSLDRLRTTDRAVAAPWIGPRDLADRARSLAGLRARFGERADVRALRDALVDRSSVYRTTLTDRLIANR